VRLELSAEIHETLKSIEEDLELVRQEVEDFVGTGTTATNSGFGVRRNDTRRDSPKESTRESEKSRLAVLLARLTEDLKV
jgi:protein transport protein SEC20